MKQRFTARWPVAGNFNLRPSLRLPLALRNLPILKEIGKTNFPKSLWETRFSSMGIRIGLISWPFSRILDRRSGQVLAGAWLSRARCQQVAIVSQDFWLTSITRKKEDSCLARW
jgi:hypothetical protein